MKMDLAERIVSWIKEQVALAGAKGVVVGLSGGVDSSVTAVLCKKAFPKTTLALLLPCFSSEEDIEHAKLLAKIFDIQLKELDLGLIFTEIYSKLEEKIYDESKPDKAVGNLKPRLRMLTLYYYANKLNYLVVGTSNKSEAAMGYFTKYGDGGVDILPLGGLLKREVKELAKNLGIPKEIIERVPSAGLWKGQTDEKEMGITYDKLDKILTAIESNDFTGCDPKAVDKVKAALKKAQHKLRLPPIFKP